MTLTKSIHLPPKFNEGYIPYLHVRMTNGMEYFGILIRGTEEVLVLDRVPKWSSLTSVPDLMYLNNRHIISFTCKYIKEGSTDL